MIAQTNELLAVIEKALAEFCQIDLDSLTGREAFLAAVIGGDLTGARQATEKLRDSLNERSETE